LRFSNTLRYQTFFFDKAGEIYLRIPCTPGGNTGLCWAHPGKFISLGIPTKTPAGGLPWPKRGWPGYRHKHLSGTIPYQTARLRPHPAPLYLTREKTSLPDWMNMTQKGDAGPPLRPLPSRCCGGVRVGNVPPHMRQPLQSSQRAVKRGRMCISPPPRQAISRIGGYLTSHLVKL